MSVTKPPPVAVEEPATTTAEAPRHPLSVTLGKYSALFLWAAFMIIFGLAKPHVFLSCQYAPVDLRRGGGHRHVGPGLPRPPRGRRL